MAAPVPFLHLHGATQVVSVFWMTQASMVLTSSVSISGAQKSSLGINADPLPQTQELVTPQVSLVLVARHSPNSLSALPSSISLGWQNSLVKSGTSLDGVDGLVGKFGIGITVFGSTHLHVLALAATLHNSTVSNLTQISSEPAIT